MEYPASPAAAVIHPNPYPYYAERVERHPFEYDTALGCWVAASAEAVTAALTHPALRVRPPAEPVPTALDGLPAGEVFRRLVRMNDGEAHHTLKAAVASTLMPLDLVEAGRRAGRWAKALFDDLRPCSQPERLSDFAAQLPLYVVGDLLGIPDESLPQIAIYISQFAACLAPGVSPERAERGKQVAVHLLDRFHAWLKAERAGSSGGLLHRLARELEAVGGDEESVIANAIGFLTQSYDATAGLIGNTLAALACQDGLYGQVRDYPELLVAAVREVLRYDSPVQNTRRFAAEDCAIAGQPVRAGEAILVLLAAANRDPAANPHPERFDLARSERRLFTFGLGAHACPGERLASTIAVAGVQHLLASGLDPRGLRWSYRPSANARIPVFSLSGEER